MRGRVAAVCVCRMQTIFACPVQESGLVRAGPSHRLFIEPASTTMQIVSPPEIPATSYHLFPYNSDLESLQCGLCGMPVPQAKRRESRSMKRD